MKTEYEPSHTEDKFYENNEQTQTTCTFLYCDDSVNHVADYLTARAWKESDADDLPVSRSVQARYLLSHDLLSFVRDVHVFPVTKPEDGLSWKLLTAAYDAIDFYAIADKFLTLHVAMLHTADKPAHIGGADDCYFCRVLQS